MALCKQAVGLVHVHDAGFWHNDIRPKAMFWSEEQGVCKIGRFAAARRHIDRTPIVQKPPYCAGYTSPELWAQMMPDMLGDHAESWASGVSLVEIASGQTLRVASDLACEVIPAEKLQKQAAKAQHWLAVCGNAVSPKGNVGQALIERVSSLMRF